MRLAAFVPAVVVSACALTTVLTGLPVHAQSLGDVAKKEEERREKNTQPSKVYTNKDLGAPPQVFATPADPAKPADGAAAPAAGTPPAGADKPKDATKDSGPAKDQKYWSDRKKALEAKLTEDKLFADALQSRINGLSADYAARSDPAQRAVIERDRQQAVAELDRRSKAIKDDQKALADFDEEARKASVPPGWLR
jgi:hypothetical protein